MDVKIPDPSHKKGNNGSCIFWIIIYTLFGVCVLNVFLTLYLISVFEIGKGMKYIEVVDSDIMNFYGSIDLDQVYKLDGLLEGFSEPFEIGNDKEPLSINLISRIHSVHNKFNQDASGTVIQGISNFEIHHSSAEEDVQDHEVVFNAQRPSFNLVEPLEKAMANVMYMNGKISSGTDEQLGVLSRQRLDVKGSEGLVMKGKDILFSADKHLNITSENGSISLQGKDGVFIDIEKFPRADTENGLRRTHVQYKMCVCFPTGRLFRVQARNKDSGCYIPQYAANPCI